MKYLDSGVEAVHTHNTHTHVQRTASPRKPFASAYLFPPGTLRSPPALTAVQEARGEGTGGDSHLDILKLKLQCLLLLEQLPHEVLLLLKLLH